jgi:hypothetical protein
LRNYLLFDSATPIHISATLSPDQVGLQYIWGVFGYVDNSKMDPGRQVFTVDLLERYAAKGRGIITCMAAGNDVILLGTSKGWIIRHDFGVGDSYGSFFSEFNSILPEMYT